MKRYPHGMPTCPLRIIILLMVGLLHLPVAHSAVAPDAGQLLREQIPQRSSPQPLPERESTFERPALADDGFQVAVKEIRFSGIEGMASEGELLPLVQGAIGKVLGFRELQALANRVTSHLKAKGYFLARAYLPQQDITDGIIEIAVVVGRLEGEIQIRREGGVRLREETAQKTLQSALPREGPLREDQLERALLLLNDLPGITARSFLEKGSTPGTSRLVAQVEEGALFSGGAWGDNYGNRYTGDLRGNGMVNLNDPMGIGDQYSLLFTAAERLQQGRIGLSLPLGARGVKLNAGFTAMNYRVGKELADLEASGSARTLNAGLSYPVIRKRSANLNAALDYEYKSLKDESLGSVIRDKRAHNASGGLSGDYYDRLLGGGYSTASLRVTRGELDLSRVAADQASDDAGPRTNGPYGLANLSLARLQRLTDRWRLNLSYSGQWATGNLDSGEKFILGGPNGVRAYPIGEASGDEGHLFSLEIKYLWPLSQALGTVQMVGFYDIGQVTLHKTPWPGAVSGATGENRYWLSGTGVGISLSKATCYSVQAIYAHRIGDNPGRSVNGKNADGREDQGRFWFQGILYF